FYRFTVSYMFANILTFHITYFLALLPKYTTYEWYNQLLKAVELFLNMRRCSLMKPSAMHIYNVKLKIRHC
mgnify:CR=1